uniref:Uncharacterized protein n=1 Tax=Triticum urartu TaxID=4572 RepID=A0A8R7UG06_TRIUA
MLSAYAVILKMGSRDTFGLARSAIPFRGWCLVFGNFWWTVFLLVDCFAMGPNIQLVSFISKVVLRV